MITLFHNRINQTPNIWINQFWWNIWHEKSNQFWGNIWREKSNQFWGNIWGEEGEKEVTSWESIFCRNFFFTFNQMFSSIRWWCFPSTKANIWENKNLFGSWFVGLSDMLNIPAAEHIWQLFDSFVSFFTQICSRLNNQSKKCFFVQLWQMLLPHKRCC